MNKQIWNQVNRVVPRNWNIDPNEQVYITDANETRPKADTQVKYS